MRRFRIIKDAKGNSCQVQDDFADVEQSSTDEVLVPAMEGKRILLLGAHFVAGATATTAVFGSKPADDPGNPISMTYQNAANGGAVLPQVSDDGYFATQRGEALTLTTGAGSTTGVQFTFAYIE